MVKKKMAKKKVSSKVVEMRMEQPKDQGDFKVKKELPIEESKALPVEKEVKPVKNPNDPVNTHVNEGYKRPSITNVKDVFTYEQFKALIEAYKKQNPAKAKRKSRELADKLRRLK